MRKQLSIYKQINKEITIMKMKKVLEVLKFIALIVDVLQLIEYIEHFRKIHLRAKKVKGFSTQNSN